jgi:glyoxalase family protein
MAKSAGIHHITGIAGEPRRHVAFYTRMLGLRMVKRTVNFDDPGTWHLYYGDEIGAPGTALTFFIWHRGAPGHQGAGQAIETAFAIPKRSVDYWTERLAERGIATESPEQRFGETSIRLRDPDGLRLALVAADEVATLPGWWNGDVPAEHAIRGFHGIALWVADPAPTAAVLTDVLGFAPAASEGPCRRFLGSGGPLGRSVDLRSAPDAAPGRLGPGTLHHLAFRATGDADQRAMAGQAREAGLTPTDQKDRQYFRSVYFREPGGVLFEIATDDPGFTRDEPRETLGTALKLPPWYEDRRAEIEQALPPLD